MTPDPTTAETARALVERHGTTFAAAAGIRLSNTPAPLWQLLVLTQLLSARISSDAAVASARELFDAAWCTPQTLRASTWHERVAALGRRGYRRYDVSTATRLDDNAQLLITRWDGDLRRLRDDAGGDPAQIARRLRDFAGIGPTGAAIFLREVQDIWPTVSPYVDGLVRKGATIAGLPTGAADLAACTPGGKMAALCAALVRVARTPTLLTAPAE